MLLCNKGRASKARPMGLLYLYRKTLLKNNNLKFIDMIKERGYTEFNSRNFVDIKVDPTTGILYKITKESVLGVQYIPKLQTAHCFIARETIVNIEPVKNA